MVLVIRDGQVRDVPDSLYGYMLGLGFLPYLASAPTFAPGSEPALGSLAAYDTATKTYLPLSQTALIASLLNQPLLGLVGAVVKGTGAWPATRPNVIGPILWIGDVDPGGSGLLADSDVWIPFSQDAQFLDEPAFVTKASDNASLTYAAIKAISVDKELLLPARQVFQDAGGAVAAVALALNPGGGGTPGWLTDNAANTSVSGMYKNPDGWAAYNIFVQYGISTTAGAGTGVRFSCGLRQQLVNTTLNGSDGILTLASSTGVVPAQYIKAEVQCGTVTGATPLTDTRLSITRLGADAADTYASGTTGTSGLLILGARLVRTG